MARLRPRQAIQARWIAASIAVSIHSARPIAGESAITRAISVCGTKTTVQSDSAVTP